MSYNRLFAFFLLFTSAFNFSCKQSSPDLIKYVDPLIGTSLTTTGWIMPKRGDRVNNGQTIPAVTAPFGMTQWTPQTQPTETKCIAPFYFGTTYIQGFRATHWLSGSCTQDYGSFTIYPFSFDNRYRFLPNQRNTNYIMNNDTLSPSYLTTMFPETGVLSEVTATKRSGFFRFSWIDAIEPTLIFDINNNEGEGYIKLDTVNQEVIGYNPVYRIYSGSGKPAGISGYFVAKFDKKFTKTGIYRGTDFTLGATEQNKGENIGGFITFNLKNDVTLLVKIGTSFTSIDNARKNLESEIPGWDFNKTKTDLDRSWNNYLSKIELVNAPEDDKIKFYTAMYHSLLHPRLFSDVNGEYPRFAGKGETEKAEGFDYYDDFSNWDIYRAQMPLLSIVAPKEYNDMVKSLVVKAEQGGWLPVFPMWNNYTSAMIGDHSASVLADAAMKGFDFDLEKAYKFMRKNAFETPADTTEYLDGKGRRALKSYLQLGFIPLEDEVSQAFHKREQVSRTIEYAYDDWAIAQVAKKLGKTEDYDQLMDRSQNYRNVFDPQKGWVCGRFADGTFTDDFNATEHLSYITEGSPKQYTFYVPHDINGIIELMGGKEKFAAQIDTMFVNHEYWHGNEPGHQIPYLYNYTGNWKKTQETVKQLLKTEYSVGPGGISGNDDAGQMSAWYVFGVIGFYPVCPGSNEYQLSSPLYEKVILHLDKKYYPGGRFELTTTPGCSCTSFAKVSLNGKEIQPVITHTDLKKGGNLSFSEGN